MHTKAARAVIMQENLTTKHTNHTKEESWVRIHFFGTATGWGSHPRLAFAFHGIHFVCFVCSVVTSDRMSYLV